MTRVGAVVLSSSSQGISPREPLVERFVNSYEVMVVSERIAFWTLGSNRERVLTALWQGGTHANASCSPYHFHAQYLWRAANIDPRPDHPAGLGLTSPPHLTGGRSGPADPPAHQPCTG